MQKGEVGKKSDIFWKITEALNDFATYVFAI
jgi:hypothetical protein